MVTPDKPAADRGGGGTPTGVLTPPLPIAFSVTSHTPRSKTAQVPGQYFAWNRTPSDDLVGHRQLSDQHWLQFGAGDWQSR
jgi:hypothetical protein